MKRDLIFVPIEPLSERYTEQWYRRLPKSFLDTGLFNSVTTINGEPLEETVKVGTFLDINSTTHYKWSQLMQISRMFHQGQIKPDTVFFFGDIEFWGIESIRLLADMNSIPVKLTGFLHAASYTKGDAFEIAAPYQQYTEVGWIAALDCVFVGSVYHRKAVIERRLAPIGAQHLADRIIVTGNPIWASEYPKFDSVQKKNQVVLTNRFDAEKNPGATLDLFNEAKRAHPDWTFLVCTGRSKLRSNNADLEALARHLANTGVIEIREGLTKDEYHRILAESKVMVSHSPEENFGYCLVEAMLYGCNPLVTEGLSHADILRNKPGHFLKQERLQLDVALMEKWMNAGPQDYTDYLRPYFVAPNLIASLMAM